ncbi:gliding motility-associated C-terminal domain-containing protein [Mesonia aestuariivivens]|uniref:Gliding motility-associated C-terminal domain-containing protein n=1 Tax=Mesonia aestuariivivens TaxID=2796128 RepID=A0ABS6W0X4_9FLAO|nr:gliding motility-associated C-terminal domain-containing protein [Mesonia aestuariivivens]MBW2961508.1 gliding motility-associated C-terminal domain-containing protein [Mesonia aestuariivivens]
MKKNYFKLIFLVCFLMSINSFAQNTLIAEITGDPADITGWELVNDASVDGEEVVLTTNNMSQYGAIYYNEAYSLNQCAKWSVEFDFRMYDSSGEYADGLAFWYIDTPPTNFNEGETIGVPNGSNGLKIAFDTYDNDNNIGGTDNPEIQVGFGPDFSEADPNNYLLRSAVIPSLRNTNYQHAEIIWENGNIQVIIDGNIVIDGIPPTQPGASNFQTGYFGFSAATGAYTDKHSVKNVQVFIDAVILNSNNESITRCDNNGDGFEVFDLTSVQDNIFVDANAGAIYYPTEEDAQEGNTNYISDPTNYTNTIAYINDAAYIRVINASGCYSIAKINLNLGTLNLLNNSIDVVGDCDNNQNGLVNFNLTDFSDSFVSTVSNYDISFYTTLTGAENNDSSSLINNNTDYPVTAGTTVSVYIKVENVTTGCSAIGEMNLQTSQSPQIISLLDLTDCFNTGQSLAFNLTVNDVNILGTQDPSNFNINYYTSQTAAENDSNAIIFDDQFTLNTPGCQTLYARIESSTNSSCYSVDSFQVCANTVNLGIPINLNECSPNTSPMNFDLTQNESVILNGENYNLSYYESLTEAENAQNAITSINNYQALNDIQTIYVRAESTTNGNCYATVSFNIETSYGGLTTEEANLLICSEALTATVNLTSAINQLNLTADENIEGYYLTKIDADNLQNPISDASVFKNTNAKEEFFVRVENSDTSICYAIYRLTITLENCDIFIPDGFSPNADGVNDQFEITGLDNSNSYDLKIYQRNGRKIYEGNSNSEPWNGKFEGYNLPVGTYFYVLEIKTPISKKYEGWVYLNK